MESSNILWPRVFWLCTWASQLIGYVEQIYASEILTLIDDLIEALQKSPLLHVQDWPENGYMHLHTLALELNLEKWKFWVAICGQRLCVGNIVLGC